MAFKRVWDENCPRVWDSWNGNDRVKWVIRDLLPEDYEEAIKLLLENFLPDETFCSVTDLANDPVSMEFATAAWRSYISQRMSLGCYEEKDNTRKLVALNVCVVYCKDHKPDIKIGGNARTKTINALTLLRKKVDVFELFGVEKYLHTACLVVHREYRGAGLGFRMLAAGDLLGVHHNIKVISGEFTSHKAQKIAKSNGFTTAATITFKDFAEAGLDYPNDETKYIMFMVKNFI